MGRPIYWTERRVNTLAKSLDTYIAECYERKVDIVSGDEGKVRILAPKLPMLQEFLRRSRRSSMDIQRLGEKYPRLQRSLNKLKDVQEQALINFTLQGAYEKVFAIFAAKNILKWRDVHEIDQKLKVTDERAYTHKLFERLGVEVN